MADTVFCIYYPCGCIARTTEGDSIELERCEKHIRWTRKRQPIADGTELEPQRG
jgi:hypothetical protein